MYKSLVNSIVYVLSSNDSDWTTTWIMFAGLAAVGNCKFGNSTSIAFVLGSAVNAISWLFNLTLMMFE